MAIDFTTDPAGLWRVIGAELNVLDSINNFRGNANLTGCSSLGDAADSVAVQYTSPNLDLNEGLWTQLESWRSALDGAATDIANRVKNTIAQRAYRDNPQVDLADDTVLAEVYKQMVSQSKTFDANACTATVAAGGSNVGDAMVVASIKLRDGRTCELLIPEVFELICTTDQDTGATLDSETYDFASEASLLGTLAWNWPDGSGSTGTLTAVDAANTDTSVNLLAGTGTFEDQTSNMVDDWTALAGTPGTDILTEASTVYKGARCVEFLGQTVATNPKIAYTLDATLLEPGMVLHFAGKVGKGASISAGILKASLVNGSNTIIDDDQGNDLATTIAHGSIAAAGSWTTFSGSFTLPKVIPSTVKFVLEASTAISDTHSMFLDHFSLTIAGDPIYVADEAFNGGLRITIHSGAADAVVDDLYTVTIANDLGGEFQTWLWRIYGALRQMPSDSGGSENIADSWIEP